MAKQGPAGAGQPSTPRRDRRPAGEAIPPPAKANGHGRAASGPPDAGEGIFDAAQGDPPEGLVAAPAPTELTRPQPQPAAAGRPPPPLGRAEVVGLPIPISWARFLIAFFSLGTLIFVVVATFVTLWQPRVPIDDLMRVLEVLFAPLVALVGVALAFYFYREHGGKEP